MAFAMEVKNLGKKSKLNTGHKILLSKYPLGCANTGTKLKLDQRVWD